MTSTYSLTVIALTRQDAEDIARRRAREDGYRGMHRARVTNVDKPVEGKRTRWAVELPVDRL